MFEYCFRTTQYTKSKINKCVTLEGSNFSLPKMTVYDCAPNKIIRDLLIGRKMTRYY